jgi:hypothetical protein
MNVNEISAVECLDDGVLRVQTAPGVWTRLRFTDKQLRVIARWASHETTPQ